MKTTKLTAFLFLAWTALVSAAAAKTDFMSGPSVYARALEAVTSGERSVTSDGLKEDFYTDISYTSVRTTADLIGPMEKLKYGLVFINYKTQVDERIYVYDKDGKVLFEGSQSWEPVETLSADGKKLSFALPSYAGNIELYLADQKIPFDGDYLVVEVNGYQYEFEPEGGFVTVPGWVYERDGTFIEYDGDKVYVTDIQTGLPVTGGKEVLETKVSGIYGISIARPDGLRLVIGDLDPYWDEEVQEVTVDATGNLSVYATSYWNESYRPDGLWYTVVGEKKPAVYLESKDGGFVIPAKKGQVFHLKFYWNKQGGKG